MNVHSFISWEAKLTNHQWNGFRNSTACEWLYMYTYVDANLSKGIVFSWLPKHLHFTHRQHHLRQTYGQQTKIGLSLNSVLLAWHLFWAFSSLGMAGLPFRLGRRTCEVHEKGSKVYLKQCFNFVKIVRYCPAFHIIMLKKQTAMGLVRSTSSYPEFNGSHFGLPSSSIHRMTGLDGKMVWTMTYSHRPHLMVEPNETAESNTTEFARRNWSERFSFHVLFS